MRRGDRQRTNKIGAAVRVAKETHQPLQKAIIPRGRQRHNKNRDVWLNRQPRGRTYCDSSTFNHSLPQNNHPAGVRLLAWGENPLVRTCKRGRGMNRRNLHVWLNRHADGLTRRYCDVYEPAYRQNAAPGRCLTPAGRTSSISHLQAREHKRRGRRAVFTTDLWEVMERLSAAKKRRMGSRYHRELVLLLTLLRRASHFTGPTFVCSPHPEEKDQPTSLKIGEGLAAAVPQ